MGTRLYDDLSISPQIETQNITTNTTVDGLSLNAATAAGGKGYSEAIAYIDVGAWTTNRVLTFKMQDAPDNAGSPGAWADVPVARRMGPATVVVNSAATDDSQYVMGAIIGAGRPWIRVTVTSTGSTGGVNDVEAHMVLGGATRQPVR